MIQQINVYPRIEIESYSNYIPISETDGYQTTIYHHKDKDTKTDVTFQAEIFSLDSNVKIKDGVALPMKEGTAIVQAVYDDLCARTELVVYDSFFKDNYKMHIIPKFDMVNLETNTTMRVLFDTLFEFLDIIYAYQKDLEGIQNPLNTKIKFFRTLSSSIGFPNVDFEHEDTDLALVSANIYRSLLDMMLDILEIRGTKSAYELFFGTLGYDIELLEFWFDDDENLVEINSTDPTLSTYDKYDIFGRRLDENEQTYEDPRPFVDPDNLQTYYNKSKYIRVLYTKNSDAPVSFKKSRNIIRQYLDFLKPLHVEYLTEMILINADTDGELIPEWESTDEELTFGEVTVIGDPEDPIPDIYQPTGHVLLALGTCGLGIQYFTSDGDVLNALGEADIWYATGSYIFGSSGSILIASGVADIGVYEFESDGDVLTASGTCSYEFKDILWDPRKQGPQLGSVIYWEDYLTQNNRDYGETGFVAGIPADFFAYDYTITPSSKTYNEVYEFSETMALEDTIRTVTRFDQEWHYDTDSVKWDSFIFVNAGAQYVKIYEFGPNEIENYYNTQKAENPIELGETEAEYEDRIKDLVLDYYDDLGGSGYGLHPDILDQKIAAM